MESSVKLELHESWSLSAIWPISLSACRNDSSYGQRVIWDVAAAQDGTLLHKDSGIKASYLYWEAL